jgi:hypothetical protein
LLYAPEPQHVLAVAQWLLLTQAMGIFVVPDSPEGQRAAHLLCEGAHVFWSVQLLLPQHQASKAVFFDAASQAHLTTMRSRVEWDPAQFPLRPVSWFDDFGFLRLPPLPLLPEHLLDPPPRPPPAVPPRAAGVRPKWLRRGLSPSAVALPEHDPKSPAFDFIKAELKLKPMSDSNCKLQAHVLQRLQFGFGVVEPTGSQQFRSQPLNNKLLRSSAKCLAVLQDNFIKLSSQCPPQAYGPFLNRPPFPTAPGGPQAIVSPAKLHRPGKSFEELLPFIHLSERDVPGLMKAMGQGSARVVQNGSAPELPNPTPAHPQCGWSLNSRI